MKIAWLLAGLVLGMATSAIGDAPGVRTTITYGIDMDGSAHPLAVDSFGRVTCAPDPRRPDGTCDCDDAYWLGFRDGLREEQERSDDKCWDQIERFVSDDAVCVAERDGYRRRGEWP